MALQDPLSSGLEMKGLTQDFFGEFLARCFPRGLLVNFRETLDKNFLVLLYVLLRVHNY